MSTIPANLVSLGFGSLNTNQRYRMLIGSQGLDKTGKTEFALSAPGPIGVLNLDIGMEGVANKWVKRGKKIWILTTNIPPIGANGQRITQQEYVGYFNKARNAYEGLLAHKDVRTVLVDTHSEFWDLAKLAEFGTVSPAVDVKQRYQALNQMFRSLIRRSYDTDKNLILTHKMKEKYTRVTNAEGKVTDSWDGHSYKKSGFGEDGYLIQVNIEHFFRDGQFGIQILNCRQNMTIAGYEMQQNECTFAQLGMMVYEGTTAKDWE